MVMYTAIFALCMDNQGGKTGKRETEPLLIGREKKKWTFFQTRIVKRKTNFVLAVKREIAFLFVRETRSVPALTTLNDPTTDSIYSYWSVSALVISKNENSIILYFNSIKNNNNLNNRKTQ